ncbi:unnamed protein product, partial [Phaeothamnion confervicola]
PKDPRKPENELFCFVPHFFLMQRKLRLSATSYIDRHPELSCLLNDFVGSVLEEKPRDVFAWAHTYFAGLKEYAVR